MENEEFLMKAKKFLEFLENDFFKNPFSESTVKNDLEIKKMIGGLSEKKRYYFNSFAETEQTIDNILSKLPNDHELAISYERCKNQINKLRNLVWNY